MAKHGKGHSARRNPPEGGYAKSIGMLAVGSLVAGAASYGAAWLVGMTKQSEMVQDLILSLGGIALGLPFLEAIRQPPAPQRILVATGSPFPGPATDRAVVAMAPLEGFLHAENELDTLGTDRPETLCKAFGANP